MNDRQDIATGVVAAVRVAIANTAHTLTHPVHAAKAVLGLEAEKSIGEMIRDEAARLALKKNGAPQ